MSVWWHLSGLGRKFGRYDRKAVGSCQLNTAGASPTAFPKIKGMFRIYYERDLKVDYTQVHVNRGFFFGERSNVFHRVDTTGNIFTSGAATSENITNGVHEKNSFTDISLYPTGKHEIIQFISCFPVGYREIPMKIFFGLTLVPFSCSCCLC